MSVLIVDGNSYLFRAAYGYGVDNYGVVHGFLSYLSTMLTKYWFHRVIVCWDTGKSRWRRQVFPEYKAGRKDKQELDLNAVYSQAEDLRQYLSYYDIPQLEVAGVEADDLIAWVADYCSTVAEEQAVVISTSDKDLWQLVTEKVLVYDHLKDVLVDATAVRDRFGVPPSLLPDVRALSGDPSDNIQGVKGVGDKTATDLIVEYGSLGQLLDVDNKSKLAKYKRTSHILETDAAEIAYRLMKLSDLKSAKYYLSTDERRILSEALLRPKRLLAMDFQRLVDRFGGVTAACADFSCYRGELYTMATFFEDTPKLALNTLQEVDSAVLACSQCELRSHCAEYGSTLAEGYADAEIMIVGRNPGHDELVGGKPFIGRAGKRLDSMLGELGLTRRDCWITNVNKCYSNNNRVPSYGEIMACSAYLRAEIDLIKPKLIIGLGNEAMSLLTPYGGTGVTKHCGEILERPTGILGLVDAYVAVCVHPSMALRSPQGEAHMKFATQKLKEFLDARLVEDECEEFHTLTQVDWDFDGETYEAEHDEDRLGTLLTEVKTLMADGVWRTLAEIQAQVGRGSEAGISARLRDLRKEKFGSCTVERRRRGDPKEGLFEYRLEGGL